MTMEHQFTGCLRGCTATKHLDVFLRHVLFQLLHQVQDCFESWFEITRSYFTVPNLLLETFITNLKLTCVFFSALPMFEFCSCLFLPIAQLPSQSNIIFSEFVNRCSKTDLWMSLSLYEVSKAQQLKKLYVHSVIS